MTRIKWRTEAMEDVVKAARKHACECSSEHGLDGPLMDLDAAIVAEGKRHEMALVYRGANCIECGRRFLPLPDDDGRFCTIGCRIRGNDAGT